jgi:flagellar basal-body rod protein FlgC
MSGIFGTLDVSGSGLTVFRTWMDAVSDNLANVNTVNTVRPTSEEAFRQRFIVAQAVDYGKGGGVQVAGVEFGDAEGRLVYDPGNPLADEQGLVRAPDVDMAGQMTQLIMAQRGYQANLAVVERAKAAYEQALGIGR